jgi:spermidine synthase
MTGRAAYAAEIDPAYIDVAVQRWQAFAGEKAILEGDGRSFAEVCESRLGGSK